VLPDSSDMYVNGGRKEEGGWQRGWALADGVLSRGRPLGMCYAVWMKASFDDQDTMSGMVSPEE